MPRLSPILRDLPPGTPVPCSSRYLGRVAELREGRVTVRGCATGVTSKRRASAAYRKQGAYLVEGLRGVFFAVPKSRVREAVRPARPMCPDTLAPYAVDTRAAEREASRSGGDPWDYLGELPFPHRRGGGACCVHHARSAQAVEKELGGDLGNPLLDDGDARTVARRLGLDGVRSLDDLRAYVARTKAHCFGVLQGWEQRRRAKALESAGRTVGRARAAALREGVDVESAEWVDALEGSKNRRRGKRGGRFVGG